MNILGLNYGHDGSACVIKDGRIACAISSERLTKQKKFDGVTKDVIQYVLDGAGISIDDINAVAFSTYIEEDSYDTMQLFSNGEKISSFYLENFGNDVRKFECNVLGKSLPAFCIPHHLSHAASAYYTSSFDESVVITLDSTGFHSELNSSLCIGKGNKLVYEKFLDLMVGSGYTVFTQNLGFGPAFLKAGSLMGMAAYGKPSPKLIKSIKFYIHESKKCQRGSPDVHLEVFSKFISNWSESGISKTPESVNSKEVMNLSASIQYLFEQAIMDAIDKNESRYQTKNLCLSGGSFLNCNVNSLIRDSGKFDNIHLFPACTDDGLSVGSALYVAHHIYDDERYRYQDHELAYLGKKYEMVEPDYQKIAEAISEGKIVAWFMGGSEFGPRALGARSILADPRKPHTREILNFVIKDREWFRPFAPAVLEEEAGNWFYPGTPSPYMLFTQKVLNPSQIPSATHVDGTARIQTVNEKMNRYFYRLIREFYKITGVPMIINTSLNGKNEPILETEEDAINFFNYNKNVDILVLNGKIIER
jgi:carbamoyltransferase